ncbi:hypothetical protein NKH77_09290 [Streptomyces sp. M19]
MLDAEDPAAALRAARRRARRRCWWRARRRPPRCGRARARRDLRCPGTCRSWCSATARRSGDAGTAAPGGPAPPPTGRRSASAARTGRAGGAHAHRPGVGHGPEGGRQVLLRCEIHQGSTVGAPRA